MAKITKRALEANAQWLADRANERPERVWAWFVEQYTYLGYKSLSQFADSFGFSKSSLSRWFHCQRHMTTDVFFQLARALEVPPRTMAKEMGYLDEWGYWA